MPKYKAGTYIESNSGYVFYIDGVDKDPFTKQYIYFGIWVIYIDNKGNPNFNIYPGDKELVAESVDKGKWIVWE